LVETFGGVVNELLNHSFGETLERQSVDCGARTLLDCHDGPSDFANVIIGGGDIQSRGKYVGVKVGDVETSGLVKSPDGSGFS
jgi:hypothetical protein